LTRSLCAVLTSLLCASCAPATTVEAPEQDRGSEISPATLERVVFEGYQQGAREVEVQAARAQVDPVARVARLYDVKISFADARRGAIVVSSEAAFFDLRSDDFVLEGEVRGLTGEGESFEGRDVRYDAAERKLRSSEEVRVYRENLTLAGEGLEIDVETRRVKIEGKVRTVVRPR
jgi:LPS export ABC transporter protein LptC